MGLIHSTVAESDGDEVIDAERRTSMHEGKGVIGFASSIVPTSEEKTVMERRQPKDQIDVPLEEHKPRTLITGEKPDMGKNPIPHANGTANGIPPEDGTLLGAPANAVTSSQTDDRPPHASNEVNEEARAVPGARAKHKTWRLATPKPRIDPDGFEDPISDAFWKGIWIAGAVHNVRNSPFWCLTSHRACPPQTEIYRKVFHAIPDDLVTTWKQYKEFILHHERLNQRVCSSQCRI